MFLKSKGAINFKLIWQTYSARSRFNI